MCPQSCSLACGHWEGLSWTPSTRCVGPTAADVTLFPHLAKAPYSDTHTHVYTLNMGRLPTPWILLWVLEVSLTVPDLQLLELMM